MYYQSDDVSEMIVHKKSHLFESDRKSLNNFPCQLNLPSLMDLQPGATAAICPRINATRPFHCCHHDAAALHMPTSNTSSLPAYANPHLEEIPH